MSRKKTSPILKVDAICARLAQEDVGAELFVVVQRKCERVAKRDVLERQRLVPVRCQAAALDSRVLACGARLGADPHSRVGVHCVKGVQQVRRRCDVACLNDLHYV